MSQKVTLRTVHTPSGDEDGENSSLDGRNEPELEPRLGTDEYKQLFSQEELDQTVNIDTVIERFMTETNNMLKEDTRAGYCTVFKNFAEFADLGSLTRRQLRGPKANALLREFLLSHVPRRSQRWCAAALKSIWTNTIDKGFPLDTRHDLGKLPPIQRRSSPPDEVVRVWKRAMDNERDPYLRLIWLLIAQYGLRPSHVSRLRWGNIRLDSEGNQTEIVADGHTEGFKTAAPVAAALTKQVVDALLEWKAIYPGEVGSEKLILPRRLANGQYRGPKTLNTAHDPRRSKNPLEMTTGELLGHWMRLQKKWGLPKLRPHELRHWVASVCRKTDLSKPASAYLMGHDSASGGAMRDWYDNPAVIEALEIGRAHV